MKGIFKIFIMTFLLFAFHSCVKEIDADIFENEYIAFSARFSDEATKAMPTVSLDKKNANIIGYTYLEWPADDQISDFSPMESLNDKLYTFDGDKLVSADEAEMIKWSSLPNPETGKLKVYAYSPEHLNFSTEIKEDGNTVGRCLPSLTYKVSTDVSEQTDIITAVSEVSAKFRKHIPLTFDHAMTAIKFRSGFSEAITVNSIQITKVKDTGTYTIGEGWSKPNGEQSFSISFEGGKDVQPGAMITDDDAGNVLFMIPQTFDANSTSEVILTYNTNQVIKTSLSGAKWEEGRMLTYTLHKDISTSSSNVIYFDLAAGNITITGGGNYSGHIYINNGQDTYNVTGKHSEANRYYVYQSTSSNRSGTGWPGAFGNGEVSVPEYSPVRHTNGTLWSDWITNNTDVVAVIEAWNDANYEVATKVNRSATPHYITVTGKLKCHITIDNLFSTAQHTYGNGTQAGIGFKPGDNTTDSELTVNIVGDNRFGNVRYWNGTGKRADNGNRLIFEGGGSLTVADVISKKEYDSFSKLTGYYANHFNSAIGATDHGPKGSDGIVINGGIIFAGTTKEENSSAIGGGGNGVGVITINGGTVTAVAHTTGTAIGGGIGYSSAGGQGYVTITGGNVYAYNLENPHGIPSAAIGGAGSSQSTGSLGEVTITGGNVYAVAVGGTAIGGGSSKTNNGGEGTVTITGGNIIAKSIAGKIQGSHTAGAGIGGGTGGNSAKVNGGKATVKISGNPIIRTGSIGGGKTNNSTGHIGSADIEISGGDIQAQFVMAAGAAEKPKFKMTGGLIRNSDTQDEEYIHIQKNGGAVYLEDGEFSMTDGEIRQCRAENGGAIYVKGKSNTKFSMTDGKITECIAENNGGAVYLEGGMVNISGGIVSHNLANSGNGGAFCIVGGNFSMPDGGNAEIYENAAFSQSDANSQNQAASGGNGGGIYVTPVGNDVSVDILSGTIQENSSDRVGGGICVEITQKSGNAKANVTVGKIGASDDNPSISNNHTIIMGGGLYAKGTNASVTINSGTIMNNTISGYVKNPNVANELGMVTLNGGNVTHVEVTYDNNAIYLGHQDMHDSWIQNIVTDTRSTMVVPEDVDFTPLTNLNYRFTGWNSRPDGKGTTYTPGQEMNLGNGLTLYAQWSIGN